MSPKRSQELIQSPQEGRPGAIIWQCYEKSSKLKS
jgi:hypothetical protein